MRSVLLAHSNHVYSDPKQVRKMQPYPPLQTILAAAVLRDSGIAVQLFDPEFEYSERAFRAAVRNAKPDLIAVCEDDFNFLSKMCLLQNRQLAFKFAQVARDSGIPCIAHGSDASDHALEYLEAGFDAVLAGEVESSLVEFAQNIPLNEIKGAIFRSGHSVGRNGAAPPVPDLNHLSWPAWDLVDMDRYRAAWNERHGYFSLNLVSSRGCPFRCNWCAKPIHGSRYRMLAPREVAAQMRFLKDCYGPDHIWFADDIFALSSNWTFEFAREVKALNASIPFKMQSRCDLMTRNTVSALQSAGCEEVWMGAESGSQRVLDAMDKDLAVEEIHRARLNLRHHGIRACFFLQFGYPGEDWSDIEATVRMIRETRPDDIGVSVSYPLPGTKFHQIVSARIPGKTNWEHSADVSMLYRGAFSTEFYRALADALHIEVRGGAGARSAWLRVQQLRRNQLAGAAA